MNFKQLFSLHIGEENPEKVKENIIGSISFRGANLWILACAILIASIGLNVNSTAVIIGAMLISPLMGPIVGAGFALATYDLILLKRSAKNLLIATIVSLLVSGIYFYLSPFKEAESELLARTSPTIYDVLIAFFGGIVGAISMTRTEKGNPIPGVAIATALMPPLCTVGFGLATFNFKFVIGAFYLYSINCFFIAISTFAIIKYLKYKPITTENQSFDKRVKSFISVAVFLMIIPSAYLAYNLLKEKEYHQKVEQFIKNKFTDNGYTVIYKKINYNATPKSIELAFLTKKFDSIEIQKLHKELLDVGLADTQLNIKQNTSNLKEEILSEIQKSNTLSAQDIKINTLMRELEQYQIGSHQLDKEVKILFPEIKDITFATATDYAKKDSVQMYPVVIYSSEKPLDTQKLEQWLKMQFNNEHLIILKK